MNGKQALCESLYAGVAGALQVPALSKEPEKKLSLLRSAERILKESSRELKQAYSAQIRALVLDLSTSNNTDYRQIVQAFLTQCTDCK